MVKAPKSATSSPTPPTGPEALAEAGWRAIGIHGWRRLTMAQVAAEAGIPVARLLEVTSSRGDLLRLMLRQVDARMLADVGAADEAEPRRDRLFDLIMRRLEILAGHRNAVATVLSQGPRDPATLCVMLAEGRRSQGLMLEAAGLSSRGLWGEARIQALGVVLAAVTRTWLNDDTDELSHTMKAVDKALDRAVQVEHYACSLVPKGRRRTREHDTGDAAKAAPSAEP